MVRFAWWVTAIAVAVGGPAAGAVDPNKPLNLIAFGSCADQDQPGGVPIFDKVTALKPDLLVLLGDNIYADLVYDAKGKARLTKDVTTDVIKAKYDALAKLPEWQRLKAACPDVMATWDDHDYGINDAGVEWPLKDDSQKLFLDFLGVPADSPRRQQKGIYSAATFGPEGKRVQVIMLDGRYFRSKLKNGGPTVIPPYGMIRAPYVANTDADATFLGDEQWKWLEAQLKQPADLRLLCSGIQVVPDDHPFEKWANIPAERDRLFRLIRDTKAGGVVILSGDRHLGELSVLPPAAGVGYPLYDLTSSGFNQGFDGWRLPDKNGLRVGGMPFGDNFGVVAVDWAAADPVVSLQLRAADGEVAVRQAFPISLLRANAAAAPPDKPAAKLPEGVVGPEEALKKENVGKELTVQFPVQAGRAVSGGKRILLNSEKDFKSEKNFTVVVNEKAMTGKFEKADFDTFKGKTIRVKGTVTLFQTAPQIQVNDDKQLEIVEEKKE